MNKKEKEKELEKLERLEATINTSEVVLRDLAICQTGLIAASVLGAAIENKNKNITGVSDFFFNLSKIGWGAFGICTLVGIGGSILLEKKEKNYGNR